jgi:hypothetical protein
VLQIISDVFGQQNDSILMIELSLFKQEMRNISNILLIRTCKKPFEKLAEFFFFFFETTKMFSQKNDKIQIFQI